MKRVVVGVEETASARQALEWAVEEAARRDARLVIVHAWRIPAVVGSGTVPVFSDPAPFEHAAQHTLRAAIDQIDTTRLRHGFELRLVADDAASALLNAAQDAELIVVGSNRRSRLGALLLGSVGRDVVRDATIPVVVVPPEPLAA